MADPRSSLLPLLLFLLLPLAAPAQDMTAEELERWLEDDSEARALAVNEGELVFLDPPPDDRVPTSRNILTIDQASIDQGWVGLRQCHEELDAVAKLQVVYRYREMKDLAIEHADRIGKAWVEGASVQLEDISRGAALCISARVRVFYQNPDQSFSLVNGPYMRKFLDGYYPYHLSLRVRFPADRLRFVDAMPSPRPGLRLEHGDGELLLDAYFEGRLNTELRFRAVR